MNNQNFNTARLAEKVVVEKICKCLTDEKDISNSDYDSFKKNNNLGNIMKHFKNDLNDGEFKKILSTIIINYGEDSNQNNNTKSNIKQLGLKTSAGALFKEE